MTTARRTVPATVTAALVLFGAACSGGGGEPIPPPPTTSVSVTAPPDPPDLAGIALPDIAGRTTTTDVALTPGDAVLSGQVVGPDGPVAGATVRLERLVDDAVGLLQVVTGPDGTWRAPSPPAPAVAVDPAAPPQPTVATAPPIGPQGLLGGRYRVRAWRSPDLALTAPTVLFLGGAEQKQLPLQLGRYSGLAVTSNVAPGTPIVGEAVNIAILVTTRSVDGSGIVRALGVPGTSVSLVAGSGWQLVRADPDTDDGGRASFQLHCRAEGAQPLAVTVNGTETFDLRVAPCALAPPSTTTTATGPDGGDGTGSTTSTTFGEPSSTSSSVRPTTTTRPGPTTPTTK